MNIEQMRVWCLAKPGATEDLPFDELTLVFKVMNKIFAIIPLEKETSISLKCNPDLAVTLREHYVAVEPAWHMSKKHWNQIQGNMDAPPEKIKEWIDHSYNLVVGSLTKKKQAELKLL